MNNKAIYIVGAGAESTGKTTMLLDLYHHYAELGYRVAYIEEYLRIPCRQQLEATGKLEFNFEPEDFVDIIDSHIGAELDSAHCDIVFCDTDPLTITIWCKRYCGRIPNELVDMALEHDRALRKLYLITEYDANLTPLVQDGLRDGSEEIRARMDAEFKQLVLESDKDHAIIGGPLADRFSLAIKIINKILID